MRLLLEIVHVAHVINTESDRTELSGSIAPGDIFDFIVTLLIPTKGR
jgi:hypothetical protein